MKEKPEYTIHHKYYIEIDPKHQETPHIAVKRVRVLLTSTILVLYISEITKHVLQCSHFKCIPEPPIKLLGEVKRYGLHSIIAEECQGCFQIFNLNSRPKLPVKESFRYDVNVRAVWGEMVTGGGVSHLNESLAEGSWNTKSLQPNDLLQY